ncbi:MAG: HD domain-containing protein [Candidatus Uhrbacteria bacterium]|nr:HD domain-containing protein [Candidatus Uhrbacteria bacterium]
MSFFRDVELLYEIGSLRNVPRGWRQHLGMDCASDLEHTIRVAYLSLIIARHEGVTDEAKILKMALVHDMPETRVSDHSIVQKVYVTNINEIQAARDMFDQTTLSDFADVFEKFEDRDSLEAKIVKDADNLDINFELKELEEQGSRLNEKWQHFRRLVRDEKLYTQTAKDIWEEVQISDPSSWHMVMNKWLKVPDAGK